MDYANAYSRVSKYNAGPSTDGDLQHLLKKLNYDQQTRAGGSEADHTFRGVVADKLQDHGRDYEAALLRDGHPVRIDGLTIDVSGDGIKYTGGVLKPNYSSYTDYGSYPLVYHSDKHGTFCGDCVNAIANRRAESLATGDEVEWHDPHPSELRPFTHEEGPPIECDGCNKPIKSAYGDPDNPEDE